MNERRVAGDGVELSAIEAGQPDRRMIVLVHGYPDTKEIWLDVMARLASRFHVIAYDVRGSGDSSAPRGSAAYDSVRLAGDLRAVVDALAPSRPVHLVGHDWGGITGWEFASMAMFKDRIASFTTIAGPSLDQIGWSLRRLLRSGRVLELVCRIYRSWYVVVLCVPGAPTLIWHGVLGGGRWSRFINRVEGLPARPYHRRPTLTADGVHGANLYRRNILRRLWRTPREAIVQVPVQLIVPTSDHFISPSYYERAEQFAPRMLRRMVPAGHWMPHSHPDRLADWIEEFVEEVDPA